MVRMNNYDQVKTKNKTRKQYQKVIEKQLTSSVPLIIHQSCLLAFICLDTYMNLNTLCAVRGCSVAAAIAHCTRILHFAEQFLSAFGLERKRLK